jgi:drug/metabolite transporter (DMT)-like permease
MNYKNLKAGAAFVFICLFWGTTWIATKLAISTVPPLQVSAIRHLLAGALIVGFFCFRRDCWPTKTHWKYILKLSLLNFILTNGLATMSLVYLPVGMVAMVTAIAPVWVYIIMGVNKKRKFSVKSIFFIFLCLSGIGLIFYENMVFLNTPGFGKGIALIVLATLAWAVGLIQTKNKIDHFNPYFSTGLQLFISGVILHGIVMYNNNLVAVKDIGFDSWVALIYLILIGTVICFAAYLYTLSRFSAEQVSLYSFITPVVATLLASLFFNEKLSIFIAAGIVLTLYGLRKVFAEMSFKY